MTLDNPESLRANSFTAQVLLEPKTKVEASENAQVIYRTAMGHIGLYLPNLLPSQPTVIIATRGDMVGGGEYLGKLSGRHYLEIGFGSRPESMDPQKKEILVSLTTHELTHQRQLEFPQVLSAFPLVDEELPEEVEKMTTYQIIDKLEARQRSQSPLSSLQNALLEGMAIQAELFILGRRLEQTTDAEQLALLRSVYRERLELLKQGRDFEKRSSKPVKDPYYLGSKLIARLVELYGMERLVTMMQAVDFQKCADIQIDEVLNNPRLIPGLEKI